MSATISKTPVTSANGTNSSCEKDRDVEKGEVRSNASGVCSRPTSSSRTSTSAEGRVELEGNNVKSGASVAVEVEIGTANNEPIGAGTEAITAAAKTRTERSAAGRWKAVGRLLRRLALIMFLVAGLLGCLAMLAVYTGPVFLVQLLVVILVAYLVSGGRFRWFYVALKTAPRDIRAISGYIKLRWIIRSHERKNRSVADVFQQHVRRHPNKVCFIFEDQEWTFQQVEDYSNKIATVFKTQGYRKGDVVAVFLENRVEFIAIWLGLSKLGIIVPLINTNLRKIALLHSLKVSKCQALIYNAELADAVSDVVDSLDPNFPLYRLGSLPDSSKASKLNEKDLTAVLADVSSAPPVLQEKGCYNDKLLYIFTSGTTGLPKAAVITNSRYMFIATGIFVMGKFRSSDVIYTPLPLYHTAGGAMAVGSALLHGATVVIRKKFSASAYFPECIKHKCTIGQYIGEMCRYILAVPPRPEDTRHSVRLMVGNGLRPQIWPEFIERFKIPQIVEFYGATEGNANIVNVDNTVGAVGFVSRIIPSVYPISIIKVNAEGEPIRNAKGLCQECEPNEPGVFVGKIANNPSRAFLGYVDEKASEKKVVHDVFNKGDSAFISGDILIADEFGYLYFKDRTGDTFRWKGENVSTSEIEAIISNVVSYRDCIVYGVQIPGLEGRAGMAAIHDEKGTLDINKLAVDLKEHLANYAIPRFIRILTKIDLTGTYKLKKKDLVDDGYDPRRIQDKLYYLTEKSEYQSLTADVYDQIQQGKIRF